MERPFVCSWVTHAVLIFDLPDYLLYISCKLTLAGNGTHQLTKDSLFVSLLLSVRFVDDVQYIPIKL